MNKRSGLDWLTEWKEDQRRSRGERRQLRVKGRSNGDCYGKFGDLRIFQTLYYW